MPSLCVKWRQSDKHVDNVIIMPLDTSCDNDECESYNDKTWGKKKTMQISSG